MRKTTKENIKSALDTGKENGGWMSRVILDGKIHDNINSVIDKDFKHVDSFALFFSSVFLVSAELVSNMVYPYITAFETLRMGNNNNNNKVAILIKSKYNKDKGGIECKVSLYHK